MTTKKSDHLKAEKTFVIIKPDGVQRTLVGEVIKRYERAGLKLIALKLVLPTKDMARKHYTLDPEWIRKVGEKSIMGYVSKGMTAPYSDPIKVGEMILERLVKYITCGPVVAMVWEGQHAVGIVRKITGSTEPLTSDVGTIRGDFVTDSYEIADIDDRAIRNVVHASGTIDEAKNEIDLWFEKGEVLKYRLVQDGIIHDVNLDGFLE
jgi:nucleoside-diphosphate kinase